MAYMQNATRQLTDYLAQRELLQRQSMLDEVERADRARRQEREDASDQMQRERFALEKKQAEEQAKRDAQQAARVARGDVEKQGERAASMFRVGDIVGTQDADVIRQGGLGALVQDSPMTIGRSGVPVLRTFAGTGDQRTAAQQVAQTTADKKTRDAIRLSLSDQVTKNPNDPNVRAAIRAYEIRTGENIPAEDRDPVADNKANVWEQARAQAWLQSKIADMPARQTAAERAAGGGKMQNAVDNANEALKLMAKMGFDPGADRQHGVWNMTRALGLSQSGVDYEKDFNRLRSILSVGGLESLRGLGPASDTDVRIVTEAATNLDLPMSVKARNQEFVRLNEAMRRLIVRAEQKGIKSGNLQGGGGDGGEYFSTDENWGK